MSYVIMDHPLIKHKIGLIRRKETGTREFRQIVAEIAQLICYEATRDLELQEIEIETPICKTTAYELKGKKLCVVPILRAGLGMVDGVLSLIPSSKVVHLGLYRDPETYEPREYYFKPTESIDKRRILILDPMLATGGSLIAAIDRLKQAGCTNISSMNIIAAPEGLNAVESKYPDVTMYIGALDERLNENKFIVPGLGDSGDRIFGTK